MPKPAVGGKRAWLFAAFFIALQTSIAFAPPFEDLKPPAANGSESGVQAPAPVSPTCVEALALVTQGATIPPERVVSEAVQIVDEATRNISGRPALLPNQVQRTRLTVRPAQEDDFVFYGFGGPYLVRVPVKAEDRVWNSLSDRERMSLVEKLVGAFHHAKPDPKRTQMLWEEIDRLNKISKNVDDNPLIHGVSPLLELREAIRKNPVGMCRDANSSIVGILLELGATPKDVRLVDGVPAPGGGIVGHLWFKVRFGDVWFAFDGTPGNQVNGIGLNELFPNQREFPIKLMRPDRFRICNETGVRP